MTAWYNEIDPNAAQWLRNLISSGLIAPGYVDERPIQDVKPYELVPYTQCHFFAGIGGWSLALRLAGWPDHKQVWTGSCPCQPFSAAGARGGFADDRHLWPFWDYLIGQRRPPVVFGEQVASKSGLAWLDLVHDDMEAKDYAFAAFDLCAAGVGAPHIRQRLWFVAHSDEGRSGRDAGAIPGAEEEAGRRLRGVADGAELSCAVGELAGANGGDAGAEGLQRVGEHGQQPQDGGAARLEHPESDGWLQRRAEPSGRGVAGGCGASELGDAKRDAAQSRWLAEQSAEGAGTSAARPSIELGRCGVSSDRLLGDAKHGGREGRQSEWRGAGTTLSPSPWDCEWLPCTDGKARPVEPGTFPLAHGIPGRVGRLRAYGNAIVPEIAAEFVKAYLETRP